MKPLRKYKRYTEKEKEAIISCSEPQATLANTLLRTERAITQAKYWLRKRKGLASTQRKPFLPWEIALILDKAYPDKILAQKFKTSVGVVQATRSRIKRRIERND